MHTPSFAIYDASAGSGKTYALVKEYLKIILAAKANDAYRNILAITFTNKAVHEMKSRIVDSLSEFCKDEPSKKAADLMEALSADLEMSVGEIKTKSRQIIRHIIHNYAAFDISTIDKFTHKVIRAFARDLNLPMTFEVSLDTENLLAEAVDALIAQAGEDAILTKLLVDFTMEKTDDDKSWDISREILETGRLALNENNRNEIAHFKDKSISEFITLKNKLADACKCMETDCTGFAQAALDLIRHHAIELNSFYCGYVPKHFEKLTTGQLIKHVGHYKYLDELEGKRYSSKVPSDQKAAIDKIANELLEILQKINAHAEKYMFYKAFLKNITPLSLLSTVSNELAKIQEEQHILSISEFNAIIHREIQNQPAPFIYERLGEKYRHFFIDEFQDTSEMQWQNLVPLIDNALAGQDDTGQKGTLMIVGDPKQSIYRWRGGKAEQFIDLSKGVNPFANKDKELISLGTNWRSYSQVIDFNNDFFSGLSEEFEHPDYRDLYENHSFQKKTDKIGGFVGITLVNCSDDEDAPTKTELHLDSVLSTIDKVLGQGFKYRDIAILTRKRGQGICVANFLTEHNIPLLSSETLMIQNATEVRFIIHLLRYLNNQDDGTSKARFLQYIGEKAEISQPVHDFIAHGVKLDHEAEFEVWLDGYFTGSNHRFSFRDIRKKSLYEAVEAIVARFIQPRKSNAYVQYFLDIVLERDVRNQAGIADFLAYWDKNAEKFSIPSPEGNDAVRILTIHKSKGLEFPVVIMPFAEEDYGRKPKDKLWLEGEDEIVDLPKVLVDNSSAVENFGDKPSLVYQQKKQEDLLDNVNVLYVALTRAEEQLYIISGMNLTSKGEVCTNNMSTFFIKFLQRKQLFDVNVFDYEFGSRTKLSPLKPNVAKPIEIENVAAVLDPANIKIAQRESLMWGTHQQEAIEYGNLLHEILANVTSAADIDLASTKAVENGLITLQQRAAVIQTLQHIVDHPELQAHFAAGNLVMNEQSIIRKSQSLIKPDRMVLAEGKQVYLLDYKTGSHVPKYVRQLENYQDAIEAMGYKVTKKALVYIGEDVKVVNL
ncbi:MAG TPA: UvrD-helicase domain-containing protein [Flavobacterium sp.]|nr:UvrD-helicase domain-containing protein [Flavobacterium sp.]